MSEDWIKVEDRLPENKTKCLTFGSEIGVTDAWYWGAQKPSDERFKGWSLMGITHWMPLPSPPTK